MRLSLSCASSYAVSYLDDFASIAAFFPGAPLFIIIHQKFSRNAANAAAIFFVVISFFAAASAAYPSAHRFSTIAALVIQSVSEAAGAAFSYQPYAHLGFAGSRWLKNHVPWFRE